MFTIPVKMKAGDEFFDFVKKSFFPILSEINKKS